MNTDEHRLKDKKIKGKKIKNFSFFEL